MTITVNGPNGVTINFPEGTDPQTINRVMAEAVGKQSQPSVSQIESFGRGAAQGLTFGFGDELYAGAKGLGAMAGGGSFQDTYNTEVEAVRKANERARQANPWTYIGGEVAGGIALPFGAVRGAATAGRAAATVGRGSRALRAGGAGLAAGAAYGFGTATGGDGSLLEQAGNRAVQAAPQAALGAVTGALTPSAIDLGTALVKGATNPIRAALRPRETARSKVAEALMRDSAEGMGPTSVLDRMGVRLQSARVDKPGAFLADVGGENTRNLLRSAANMPSRAASRLQRRLDTRQSVQWSRIEKDIAKTLADGDQFGQVMDDLTQQLKTTGAREFGEAYQVPLTAQARKEIADFVEPRGYMRRLVEKTSESIRGMTGENPHALEIGKPWEFMHRVKMEIDREIGRLKKGQPDPKANWTLRDLVELKKQFVGILNKNNPKFERALNVYGDEAGLRGALERGADEFKKRSPQQIERALRGMTQAERSMYRMGAARKMFDDLESSDAMHERVKKLFSSPAMMKKMKALYPDQQSFREMQRQLILESKMAKTRAAAQGNSTSVKQLAHGEDAGKPAGMLMAISNAAAGRFAPMLDQINRGIQRFHGMTPEVANDVINAMLESGTLGTRQQLEKAMARAAREPRYRDALTQRFIQGAAAFQASVQPQTLD